MRKSRFSEEQMVAIRAGDVNGQALAGELVDHRQALDLLSGGSGVKHEVVRPQDVGRNWCQWPRTSCCNAPARPTARQLQASLAPQPVCPVYAEFDPLQARDRGSEPPDQRARRSA